MERVELLDHGYASLVETWGSDERVIEAARMSTGKGFNGWGPKCSNCGDSFDINAPGRDCPKPSGVKPYVDCGRGGHKFDAPGDEKLLRFLWTNKHHTPFEMAGATFEVQAPIFVFREWHRHRVPFGYNEASARYSPLPDLAYLPDAEDVVKRSKAASEKNRQAGLVEDADVLTLDAAQHLLAEEADLLVMVEDLYQRKLKAGFTKELARTHLTVSRYSKMRATANLRGWLAFLALRNAPNAQQEIRVYAQAVQAMLAERFPRTLALFAESR